MSVTVDLEELGKATVDLPYEQVEWVESKNVSSTQSWEDVVGEALANPIGSRRLKEMDLTSKRVLVITDDWGRPTPAHRVLPSVLAEVEKAGARREDITVMTGSGVHEPMNQEDLIRKVGQEVFSTYRCISHDAVEHEMAFVGVTSRGTPLWINKIAFDTDVRIAVGRVGPHITHGYEGGAKMITPAVSYWLTVLRNHSANFSPYAEYGSYECNPCRQDVDEIGGMVGLDFIVNFVINRHNEPIKAFAGHRLAAHRSAIAWGDRNVWGAEIGQRADIVIAKRGDPSPGHSPLELAALACAAGKTLIFVTAEATGMAPALGAPVQDDVSHNGVPVTGDALRAEMPTWTFDRIFMEHERRDMDLPPRAISDRCKTIRGEYYRRRASMTRNVILVNVPDAARGNGASAAGGPFLQEAVDAAIRREGRDARVLALPQAATTVSLERFHTFEDGDKSVEEWEQIDAAAKVVRYTQSQLAGKDVVAL